MNKPVHQAETATSDAPEGEARSVSPGRQSAAGTESSDTRALRAVIGKDSSEPRTVKARQTQQKILEAAAEVFATQGYEAARVADIARLAGVAHCSFYRYFTDKDAILQELLVRLYAELGKATRSPQSHVEDADHRAPALQLQAFNITFFHEYAKRRGLLRVAREAAASAGDGCFREIWFVMRGRFIARTQRLIERLQQRGHAIGLDPALTAEALGAMSEQMAYVLVGLADAAPDESRLTEIGKACNEIWVRTLFAEHSR
ncbi:MAG: TetR/AcrR family transcriptional regulator [Congregibacter sp.]